MNLRPGRTRIRVMNAEKTEELGLGTYLGELKDQEKMKALLVAEGKTNISTAIIRLDNGEVVHGYECWWCVEEPEFHHPGPTPGCKNPNWSVDIGD